MGLLRDTETEVERPISQQDREDTVALNEYRVSGRTQEFQSIPFSVEHRYNSTTSITTTLTQDIVLTQVQIRVSAGANTATTTQRESAISCGAGGSSIAGLAVFTNNYSNDQQSAVINIPNWILRRGQTLNSSCTDPASCDTSAIVNFIGFLA